MPATVAACQMAVDDLDVEANLSTVESRVEALPDSVDVACFPEQALTGFVPDDRIREAAVPTDGDVIDRLCDSSRAVETDLLVGFVERDDSGSCYNTAAYVAGGTVTRYRKRHLWAGEAAMLEPGEELVTLETPLGETGVLTCYDLNFVEDSAALTDQRLDALIVPGAWPATHSDNWRLLVRARALDGVRWAVGAGRTGRRDVEGARVMDYTGRSLVVRPDGGIRAELNTAERDLVVDLDEDVLPRQRQLVGIFEE